VEQNDDPWPTSINAYHDTGDPDWDCAWRVVSGSTRGSGVRRADCQQSDRHTTSQCGDTNRANPVGHHDTGYNDHSNRCANSSSDCYAGADASSERDRDSNSDAHRDAHRNASAGSHGDAHRDESANGVSHQDHKRDGGAHSGSAHGGSDHDTGCQANTHNDANPGEHSNTHPATERKREGDTGACASGLNEHHL
jgi:hypothetical protein